MRSPNPASDYALRLWQSTYSRTRLSRLFCPLPIDTAAEPLVQQNSMPGGGSVESEKKYRLKCRKNRLQVSRNLHCLQFLQLIRVEDGHELREKGLLCLGHLLLQRVDLDHHYPNLCRVSARIQQ